MDYTDRVTHGHAPRVRRRKNSDIQTGASLEIDKNELLNTVVTSAIGGVVGAAATRVIFGGSK